MKKLTFMLALTTLVIFATTDTAAAQSATGSVSASATIQALLNVTQEEDLGFGVILPGDGATVEPGTSAGAGQSVGRLRIQHNSDVAVTAVLPSGLSLGGEPDLPVSFSCGFSESASGALDGSATDCDGMPNRSGNGDATTRVTYLQVGGSILGSDTSNRTAGTYTGTLVFTVAAVY